MNSLIQKFREASPRDPRSDIDILLDVGDNFPEALSQFPDAQSDYDRIKKAIYDAGAPSWSDYVKNIPGAVARGVAGDIASLPKSLAIGGAAIDRALPEPLALPDVPAKERILYKLGEAIEGVAPSQPDDKRIRDSFLFNKLPEGVGSALGFALGGLVGKVARIPAIATTALMGAAAQGSQAYDEAKAKGATEDQATQAWLLNSGVGTSEVIPIAEMLNRLDKASGGTFKKALFHAAKETFEESVQEAAQQTAQNFIAHKIYDPNQQLFEGVGENAAIGGATGFLMSALTSAIGHKLHGHSESATPSVATQPAPEVVAQNDINPADTYKLTDDDKAKISGLIDRELTGDNGTAFQVALGSLYQNPDSQQFAFYQIEKGKKLRDQAVAQQVAEAQRREAERADAERLAAERESALQAQIEQVKQRDQNEPALQAVAEPSVPEPAEPVPSPAIERARDAAVNYEPPMAPWAMKAAVQSAESSVDTAPSEAQKESGNYKKGHVNLHGLDITIENPVGSRRSGQDAEGNEWSVEMPATYGYVRGTEGKDGDHSDVYIGPNPASGKVWVVDQIDPSTGKFDEHKSLLGFNTQEEAIDAYNRAFSDFSGPQRMGAVTELSIDKFKDWLNTGSKKPLAYGGTPKAKVTEAAAGPQFNVEDVDIENVGTQVNPSSKGSSKETLPAFYQVGDGSASGERLEAIGTRFSPELGEMLTRQASKNSKLSKNWTHRLTAFEAPDGSVALLGTFKRAGKDGGYFVASKAGKSATSMSGLMEAGYKPFASVRLKEASNNPVFTYANREAYDAAFSNLQSGYSEASDEEHRDRSVGAAIEDQMTGVTMPEGLAGNQTEELTAEELATQPLVTDDEGDAIWHFVSALVDGGTSTSRAAAMLFTQAHGLDAARMSIRRFVARQIASGNISGSESEVLDQATERVADLIEHAYEQSESREQFIRTLADQGGVPGRGQENAGGRSGYPGANVAQGVGEAATGNGEGPAKVAQDSLKLRTPQRSDYRIRRTDVSAAFYSAIDGLSSHGIDVRLLRAQVGNLLAQYGSYDNAVDSIAVALADAHAPTAENLVYLFHEAAHAVFARETPARQEALQNAVASITDAEMGIAGFKPVGNAEVDEERLVESAAQRLVAQGFNPAEASGIFRSIIRFAKDLYYKVALAIQESRFGQGYVNPAMAQAYFLNRLEAALAGRPSVSFLTFIGGRPKTTAEKVDLFDHTGFDLPEVYDWKTGRMLHRDVLADSVAAVRLKYRGLTFVTETQPASPDVGSSLNARDVAANNAVDSVLKALYSRWSSNGNNPSNLTFEQFVHSGAFVEVESLPLEVIDAINQSLIEGKQPPVPAGFTIADIPNDSVQQRAAAVAHRILSAVRDRMATRARDVNWSLSPKNSKNLLDASMRSNNRINQLTKDYTNAELLATETKEKVFEILNEFKGDVREVGNLARKAGQLSQVILGLDERLNKPMLTQYERALNRLYSSLGTDTGSRRFYDILDAVSKLSIDWKTEKPGDIKRALALVSAGDAVLHPLSRTDAEGKALLLLVIAFGKSNRHVMDLMSLRRSDALTERTTVNEAIAKAKEDSSDSIRQARNMVKALPRLGAVADRILTKLEEHRVEARAMHDEIVRARAFVDFYHDGSPLIEQELARLETQFGAVRANWEPTDGAEYTVPESSTVPLDRIDYQPKKKFSFTPGALASGELKADLKKMKGWLDTVPADQRGAKWGEVKQQYDKLSMVDVPFNLDAIHLSTVDRWIGSIVDRIDQMGSPSAKQIARRLRRAVGLHQSLVHPAEVEGFKWAAAEAEAMRLAKLDHDSFGRMFYDGPRKWLESRQDIQAASTEGLAEENALKALRSYLAQDPATAKLMANPKLWPTLERFYKATRDASGKANEMRATAGLKILDASEGYAVFREAIGGPLFHGLRGLSKQVVRAYEQMLPEWGGAKSKLAGHDIADAYNTDRAALQTTLKARFTPEILKNFVQPLINRPGRSAFYAGTGDVNVMASRAHVVEAFERSGGDMLAFAEHLYRLEGKGGDMAEFVGDTLQTFQNFFDQLKASIGDLNGALDFGLPVPPRQLMDARKSEEFPAEWLDYVRMDPHTMRNLSKLFAYESACGRDMGGIDSDFDFSIREQEKFGRQYQGLLQQAKEATAGKSKRALRDELNRLATAAGGDRYLAKIETADLKARELRSMKDTFHKFLKAQSGTPMEARTFSELLSTLTALTVQGPGTAMSDTISAFEQPLRKLGLNTIAGKQIAQTGASFLTQAFGTLLQTFGVQLKIDADHIKLMNELGIRDPDATLTLKQRMLTIMNDPRRPGQGGVAHAVVTAGRLARGALSTGIGQGQFPTFKPWAAFTQIGQWMHAGSVRGIWKIYEDLAGRAVKHYESAAGASDLADEKFRFDARKLGYGASVRAFDYMVASMERLGFNLETTARNAVEARRLNPAAPLLTREQYRLLASLSQNEMTMEANPVNRAPGLITNPVLAWASPLVGWTISKANSVAQGFREPGGERSKAAFAKGLMPYLAIIPMGLAYAWLRDEWDEKVTGKKANVLPANSFLGMLDRLGRVGTFGVVGDLVNSVANVSTNRPFDIDHRVLFVSSTLSALQSLSDWIREGDAATYATVTRPLIQALGGAGYLQYVDGLNNALSLDNAEARVIARISVANYLRSAGREMSLDVRVSRGPAALANPIAPWVGEMVLAAYANNASDFREAYRSAITEARAAGKDEPEKYVQHAYASRNPLKSVFQVEPSPREVQQMLASMDDQGRTDVSTALRMFNSYGQQIGVRPDVGREVRRNPSASLSLDEIRRRAVSF